MTIDKKVDCIKLAKEVVRQTRNDVLISKTQMTDIAASHPSRSAWIEIPRWARRPATPPGRTPHGVRGLKSVD